MDAGSSDKKLVRVIIFQQPYTLRASGDPRETQDLAASVDELMNQIAAKAASTDPARVAVLASLHLADRVRKLERTLEDLGERVADLDRKLSDLDLDN